MMFLLSDTFLHLLLLPERTLYSCSLARSISFAIELFAFFFNGDRSILSETNCVQIKSWM